jgi:hypothetical protein
MIVRTPRRALERLEGIVNTFLGALDADGTERYPMTQELTREHDRWEEVVELTPAR